MVSTDRIAAASRAKAFLSGAVLLAAMAMMSAPAIAQTAPKPLIARTADIEALTARAKASQDGANPARPQVVVPMISAGPYIFNLERHSGKGPGSLHPIWAEYIVVLQGAGTFTFGGTVTGAVTSADGNVHGPDIAGGTAQHVVPGDLMMVPEGVSHMLESDAGAPLIVATLHLPHSGAAGSGASKLIHHAADLPASGGTLLSLAPYQVKLGPARNIASLNKNDGAFLFVLEGEGDLVTGGDSSHIKKGEFIYVPKNVAYQAKTDGTFVLATLQVPEP